MIKKELPRVKYNRSYTYLSPMLSDEALGIKYMLRNAFIADEDYPEFNYHIFLLYQFSGDITFSRFEKEVEYGKHFVKSYDVDKYQVMKVFSVPDKYKKEYDLFMDSKYSKFSESYKNKILEFHNLPKEDVVQNEVLVTESYIADVLWKRERAFQKLEDLIGCKIPRNQEASGKWEIDREIFNSSMKIKDAYEEFGRDIEQKEIANKG